MSADIYTSPNGEIIVKLTIPYIEKSVIEAITKKADEAVDKLVEKFWIEHQDKIMAKIDLTGLANLIAIHASGALKK